MINLVRNARGLAHPLMCMLILLVYFWGVPTRAGDIPVETEADYGRLIDAIRAAEYTRQYYLEENANPRAIAAVSGLWAFAERNPLATPEQLLDFVFAYDAELAGAIVADPMLLGQGSFLTAMRAARPGSAGVLMGTDTRVGDRGLDLLGMALPGLDGYQQSRQRMARFDLASVRRLINRTETADVLTGVLAGVDVSGRRVEGLRAAGAAYLESVGFTPMLGLVDPDQPEVNAGLAGLPSYAEFVVIRDTPGGHLGLEDEVFASIDAIQVESEAILNEIGTVEIQPGLAIDSAALFAAAADPDDPNHAAAVAALEARRQAVVDSIRDTSDDRAAVFARTLLLQQSQYPDVQHVATTARSFAGLQLQTNNDLAVAQQTTDLIGSGLGLVAAYASGDVWGGVQSLTDIVSNSIGLADLLGDGPPSAEEQIFGQIVALRQQVEGLRVQMNARFDIVDAKLDSIFQTMITGFGSLGQQIGDLQDSVDDLAANIAEARTTLDRIEAALFGFAEDLLLLDLSIQTDLVLNYRGDTGVDLAYNDETPSFVTSANFFFNFATSVAQNSTFAGTGEGQPLVLTLDNAADELSAQPIARMLNDLRRVPSGLFTVDGDPVIGPITASRVPAPAPWSQGASAYTQLAKESPWYFAYMLQTQQANGGGSGPQVDQVIGRGERIVSLADATRERDDLWDSLLTRAFDDVAVVGGRVDQIIDDELVARGLKNAGGEIDPWGTIDQPAVAIAGPFNDLFSAFGRSFGLFVNNFTQRGYEAVISDNRTDDSAGLDRAVLAERNALAALLSDSGEAGLVIVTETLDGPTVVFGVALFTEGTGAVRRFVVRFEFLLGGWQVIPGSISPAVFFDLLSDAWYSGGFSVGLPDGDLEGRIYPAGTYYLAGVNWPARMIMLEDTSSYDYFDGESLATQETAIESAMADVRSAMQSAVVTELITPGTPMADAGVRLDNTAALTDAYVTLGLADAYTKSELLRTALRGVPSADGIGFRSDDVLATVLAEIDTDDGSFGGSPDLILPELGDHLIERVLAFGVELETARASDAPSFPYVEFVLSDLRDLRDNAFRLAIDDTYLAPGAISVDTGAGLIANDVGQPGRINNEDLMVDLDFFASSGHTPPANGAVTVFADGSFQYTPDPGFEGEDWFDYRLVAEVGDPDNPVGDPMVFSEPATVVLRVGASDCLADFNGDGVLNFFDLSGFIGAYGAGDLDADLNGDGRLNFFDITMFISLYTDGCP